jgi:ATP-dependent RNA helicase RhlE
MDFFKDFNISKQLGNGLLDMGFEKPTPIQREAFPVVLSGKDIVGIAQTGTGKTIAFLLPILQDLKFSNQSAPRVLILVPTRELVLQIVKNIEMLSKYINVRVFGVYGGVNIRTQAQEIAGGSDIIVSTPGRIFDLGVSSALSLKSIKKLVIDEVDVMLDLGFRTQLKNIFDLLPVQRQNIMFSATMTDEVDALIDTFFVAPKRIAISVSGTPLDNIAQTCYPAKNFNTKINLLAHLLIDRLLFSKVIVFVSSKKLADRLHEYLGDKVMSGLGIIHSNKAQNNRIETITSFDAGLTRVLIATDVIARGIDLDKVTQVINFDVPEFPENYIHRIGRSGRAEAKGQSIMFFTEKELERKINIEELMKYTIPQLIFPEEVEVNNELIPEERDNDFGKQMQSRNREKVVSSEAFHDKSAKNSKTNQGGSYHREIAEKYKKPRSKGDKAFNLRKNKKK